MAETSPKAPGQPFTLGGLARYAGATAPRLLVVALVFALLAGGALAALFALRWSPVIGEAIGNLPEQSLIAGGNLSWPENKGRLLAANAFASFSAAVDSFEEGAPVDFMFLFGPRELHIRSLLGVFSLPYPSDWTILLNRTDLVPLWGAWKHVIVPLLAIVSTLGLILSWSLLAIPYTLVLRFFALILGKRPSFGEAWKICVAAQWPGALLLAFVLGLYAAGQTTLVLLLAAYAAHFVLTLLYIVFTPVCLSKAEANPFGGHEDARPARKGRKNPFKG